MTTRIQDAVPEFEVLHNFPHFRGPEIYMLLVWNTSQLSLGWKASVVLSPMIEFGVLTYLRAMHRDFNSLVIQ